MCVLADRFKTKREGCGVNAIFMRSLYGSILIPVSLINELVVTKKDNEEFWNRLPSVS